MRKIFLNYATFFSMLLILSIGTTLFIKYQLITKWRYEFTHDDSIAITTLAEILSTKPKSKWQEIIEKWSDKTDRKLKIYPFDKVKLQSRYAKDKLKRLKKGHAVLDYNDYVPGIAIALYIPIPNSKKILEVPLLNPQLDPDNIIAKRLYWNFKAIQLILETTPKSLWQDKLKEISNNGYLLSINLLLSNEIKLPDKAKEKLNQTGFVLYDPNPNDLHTGRAYQAVKLDNQIYYIEIKGHNPIFYDDYLWWILLIIFLILSSMIFIFTYPLYKNTLKLQKQANYFANGNFNQTVAISKFSIMSKLHQSLIIMGKQINQLIKTNQNLTYGLSHELKTPITRSLFSLNKLAAFGISEQENAIEAIKDDLNIMTEIINEMLLYAKFEAKDLKLQQTKIKTKTWLESLLMKWQIKNQYLPTKLTYHLSINNDLFLKGDTFYLAHAIENLLKNASQYGNGEIKLHATNDEAFCYISIEDNGCGIDLDHMQDIFRPFFRLKTHANIEGHGLGLSLVKQIILAHHGTIDVKRSALGGSKFTLKLPIAFGKSP